MSVIVQYPITEPTDVLTLPNPKLGNSKIYNINTKFKMAMDGKIYSYIKTPITRKLLIIFDNLTITDISNIWTFIKSFGHLTLRFKDWVNNYWDGNIIGNPLEKIKPNRGFFSIVFEFVGILQDLWDSDVWDSDVWA